MFLSWSHEFKLPHRMGDSKFIKGEISLIHKLYQDINYHIFSSVYKSEKDERVSRVHVIVPKVKEIPEDGIELDPKNVISERYVVEDNEFLRYQ